MEREFQRPANAIKMYLEPCNSFYGASIMWNTEGGEAGDQGEDEDRKFRLSQLVREFIDSRVSGLGRDKKISGFAELAEAELVARDFENMAERIRGYYADSRIAEIDT